MNRYQFHQAVHIAGVDYRRGFHEVPEKAEYDPTFLKYVGLGLITEADAKAEPPSLQTIQERNKTLHDRLVKRADDRKAAAHAAKGSPVKPETTGETGGKDEDDFFSEKSPKEKPSHADKHKKK